MKRRLLFSLLALTTGLGIPCSGMAAPPTNAEVGDADSFGKRVNWIGLVQTGTVILVDDCGPIEANPTFGPDDRCIPLGSPPLPINEVFVDLGRITLPKNSTDDLICHWVTPIINFGVSNDTLGPVNASFRSSATFRIESTVLAGPPNNGYIDVGLTMHRESGTLAPGAVRSHQVTGTRTCIGGLISKSQLIDSYGLTDRQATQFFKEPITIRAGVSVNTRYVNFAQILYGTRFTGDHN